MNLFKSFIPFAFVLLLQVQLRAQVVINEIQSVNESTIKDFQDEYPDWIELYNSGNSDVNLTGFGPIKLIIHFFGFSQILRLQLVSI